MNLYLYLQRGGLPAGGDALRTNTQTTHTTNTNNKTHTHTSTQTTGNHTY